MVLLDENSRQNFTIHFLQCSIVSDTNRRSRECPFYLRGRSLRTRESPSRFAWRSLSCDASSLEEQRDAMRKGHRRRRRSCPPRRPLDTTVETGETYAHVQDALRCCLFSTRHVQHKSAANLSTPTLSIADAIGEGETLPTVRIMGHNVVSSSTACSSSISISGNSMPSSSATYSFTLAAVTAIAMAADFDAWEGESM